MWTDRQVVILSSGGCTEITLPSLAGRFTRKTFQTLSKPLSRNWRGSITEIDLFILTWSPCPNNIYEWNMYARMEQWGEISAIYPWLHITGFCIQSLWIRRTCMIPKCFLEVT